MRDILQTASVGSGEPSDRVSWPCLRLCPEGAQGPCAPLRGK